MNYYNPNFYQGFQAQPSYYQSAPATTLNGKLVDGIEMVKGTDVPIGGYGVFPKADLSEVYIKSWNQNGTTSILRYAPSKTEEPTSISPEFTTILERISLLEAKLDKALQQAPVKEDIVNAY